MSNTPFRAGGGEKKEHLYKILVIGELGTGKTSIIKRYVHQFFSQHYRATGDVKTEHVFKVLIIGEISTGKTSFLKRYVQGFFTESYKITIGVDFALKVLNWDAETIVRLQLWDIAGQERFGNMTRVYYKEAVGAFIVFDLTRASTFDAVTKWKNDLDLKVQLPDGRPVPCVLLANKCDQPKEGLMNNASQIDEFCKERGFIGWFETSAKENINIDESARFLVTQVLTNDREMKSEEKNDEDIIRPGSDSGSSEKTKKSGCCS